MSLSWCPTSGGARGALARVRPRCRRTGIPGGVRCPLQIGAIRLGVLLAQRDSAGPLASAALSCLLALAEAATGPLLTLASKEPGPLWLPDHLFTCPPEVH